MRFLPTFLLSSMCLLLSCSVFAQTSMPVVLAEQGIQQCKKPLVTLAETVIGKKQHRLYFEQPKRHADQYPFSVTGVIAYHDQDAQIAFYASPLKNGECEVSYVESFAVTETCMDVREQMFKKWKFVGRLSEDSFFLRHKKDLTRNATLSPVNAGAACLVTRRDSGI